MTLLPAFTLDTASVSRGTAIVGSVITTVGSIFVARHGLTVIDTATTTVIVAVFVVFEVDIFLLPRDLTPRNFFEAQRCLV